jgi:phosphate transport system permease protein
MNRNINVQDANINNKSIVKEYRNKNEKKLRIKRKCNNFLAYGIISLSTIFTVGILLWILGFIFSNGIGNVNYRFLTSKYESETQYIQTLTIDNDNNYSNKLGLELGKAEIEKEEFTVIERIEKTSYGKKSTNKKGNKYPLKKGDIIRKINGKKIDDLSIDEINTLINNEEGSSIILKVTRPGKGILPMIKTTILIILLSLIIACPVGIFAAIYLTEYAKPGRFVTIIRFATESLAGIPSIIYGLFGMIFFVITLELGYSIISGALTLSILLLPVIIRQTEESLKAVPMSYREGSLGLGATKLQTIIKAVLPSAIPGIIVAIILSIGRIIGESAALYLTAGTTLATLTVKAYAVAKEESNIAMACSIGTVVILIILILNGISKLIARRYHNAN